MSIASPPSAATEREPTGLRFRWFPIRSLAPRHRPRILAHLLALSERDRYLRFGYAATDAHIGRYVDQLDFDADEVFGVFNRRLQIVAMAHLAFLGHDERHPSSAEFGVSVLPHLRSQGVGSRLFERACLHARSRGVDTLIVHALTENRAMLRIALAAGATMEHHGPDATARLRLPPEDIGSQLEVLVDAQAGDLDFGVKRQARRIDRLWRTVRGLLPGTKDARPR